MKSKLKDKYLTIITTIILIAVCAYSLYVIFYLYKICTSTDMSENKVNSKSYSVIHEQLNVGDYICDDEQGKFDFFDTSDLVYTTDKQDMYYKDGIYYLVRENIVVQKQYYEVVDREMSIIDYFKTFNGFKQDNAEIKCISRNNDIINYDLSTPWEKVSFRELDVYWKYNNSQGISVVLQPEDVAVVIEYLDYTDLLKDYGLSISDDAKG